MKIGIVGVGAITSDVALAIEDVNPGAHTFYLSPRSSDRSAKLSAKYVNFIQCESNQEAVDQSDLVMIGVLPTQVDELLPQLNFRADHIIASMAAGKAPSHVAKLIAPATKVAQLIPLPMIEFKKGPIVICPPIAEISKLLNGLGDIVELKDETLIPIFSAASASMSTLFNLTNTIANWIQDQGIDFETSTRYATSLVEAIGTKANHIDPENLAAQTVKHETPGGLNESVRTNLEKENWFVGLSNRLDYLIDVFIPGLQNKK